MQGISEINALHLGRKVLSQEEREQLRQEKSQQERDNGYQQLVELCYLGEYDAAKQLANRNQKWGYEIVDKMVMERID